MITSKKTSIVTKMSDGDRSWFIVDASEHTIGELSVAIANALRGKLRPDFTPHIDMGGYVVVLNADKPKVTGRKEYQKIYYSHSGYVGNLKERNLKDVREKSPKRILQEAVSGMLPKNKHRKGQMKRLVLVMGNEHKHEAQKPAPLFFLS